MINIIYIYPNIKFINKEINICRIIDNKIKEHEKLPPIRKLANYMNVNNATIQ